MTEPASGSGGRTPAPGEPTTDRVQGIFSRIAGTYDRVNVVASLGIMAGRNARQGAISAAFFFDNGFDGYLSIQAKPGFFNRGKSI